MQLIRSDPSHFLNRLYDHSHWAADQVLHLNEIALNLANLTKWG